MPYRPRSVPIGRGRDNRTMRANMEDVVKVQRREVLGVLTAAAGSAFTDLPGHDLGLARTVRLLRSPHGCGSGSVMENALRSLNHGEVSNSRSALDVLPEGVGEFGAEFIEHATGGALDLFDKSMEIVAGAGDSHHADGG